jgi:MFS family permease
MIVAPISGTLSDRMDSRYISSAGMAVMGVGMWLLSNLKADSPYIFMIVGLIIIGLGIGLFQTPNNSAIMGSVPNSKRGVASGMLATMRNIGMVLGVAISGAIFTSSHDGYTKLWKARGLYGIQLEKVAFEGALHIAYTVGALLAFIAVITSLIKGSTRVESK